MKKTALLIVDIQEALIRPHPYDEAEFIGKIKELLNTARRNDMEVIYVRHDGGKDDELEAGTEGFQIYHEIAPMPGEKIFDKRFNSAFKDTGLKAYLENRGVTDLILVGMQTEYCIDATCKSAFEHGYSVTIPAGATTTFPNKYLSAKDLVEYYEQVIWNNRFAQVIPAGEILEKMPLL